MNSNIINYTAICQNCNNENNFTSMYWSEDDDQILSIEDLSKNINEFETSCPDCNKVGYMKILIFKINNLIIDIQRNQPSGTISIIGEKSISKNEKINVGGSGSNFNLYDYYNTVNLFLEELNSIKNGYKNDENDFLNSFNESPSGNFEFTVKLFKNTPYMTVSNFSTNGFSFEELYSKMSNLKKKIKSDINDSDMPF